MIVFSRKKSVKHMLLAMHEEIEQCVVMFLEELRSRWSVGRIQTSPDSSSMRCRSSAVTKPHQALDVYSSLAITTDSVDSLQV